MHITAPANGSGSGNGTVNYSYDVNPTLLSRTGTITVGSQTLTITQAGGASVGTGGLRFVPVPPCRIADTRLALGAFGSPNLAAGTPRDFDVLNGPCNIPRTR